MARPLRIEYAGAVYHVMARGDHGQAVYVDDLDRRLWLRTLADAVGKTGWRVHAYVLMDNHYHMLLAHGLVVLGLDARRLSETPKGTAHKQVLAWWLRQRTTVGRRWVSERLGMGEESGVTRAVRRVNKSREAELENMKALLRKAIGGGEEESTTGCGGQTPGQTYVIIPGLTPQPSPGSPGIGSAPRCP
jgi:hypothetical protein